MRSATMSSRKHQERDPETGRYVHTWGFVGTDDDGREFAQCQDCGNFRVHGVGGEAERRIKSYAALIAAYPTFREGSG